MTYSVDINIDPSLDGFVETNIVSECPWAADKQRLSAHITKLVEFALGKMGVAGDIEVSVSLVTRGKIHELNRLHREIDSPTDVLSFPCDSPDEVDGQICELGDIVFSPEVAFEQSHDYGNTYIQELNLLVVHSVLHLLGYDHIDDDDAKEMEAKEREILADWENA